MRKLSSLIAGASLTLTAGLLGCVEVDPTDPFDSLTTQANDDTTGDGDGDSGDGDGDTGDGDTGDGDGDTGDGDGDTGDGDGDACGQFGDACDATALCCDGLSCGGDGTCGLGGGDGDGDGDGDPGEDPWNPATCAAPSQVLMVGNLPGNFCAAPCANNSADCPPGPDMGTAGQCALTTMMGADPSFCALVCQVANDACPAGSSCKDLMDPMNPGLGLCTYP